ncbi:OmpA family protein [uncultured Alsobacter sp.]|uniref:OmpA family protein n=1 Tax=uncultured Alsobacter sp. TaxID=1748258 RepID=UPI0025E4C341|nr:OmpA family protein [uncultured Alsobacter sp.]
MIRIASISLALPLATLAGSAFAQEPAQAPPPAAPAPLVLYFDTGSAQIRDQDKAVLDQASRAYSQGKPIVMIVTGTADRVGAPAGNLTLSQRRATAVLNGLIARGIPADRFQVLAKGETEPVVSTEEGVAELQNRRVEITWR